MNVLIVDKDKRFVSAVTKAIKKDSNIRQIKIYNDEKTLSHTLKENDNDYTLGLIDLDTITTSDFINNEKTKYIVYSSNSKKIKKYINNPFIQRVFQKPINLINLTKYLNNYCNVLTEIPKENNILKILSSIGFNTTNKGTQYLCLAIEYALEGISSSPKELCKIIGEKNSATSDQILWAINNSINAMMRNNYRKTYFDFFKIYDERKPTPKYIINYFVQQRLKLRV